ncbi:MAG TPA: penicillin acylase family protein [Pyrinomonadaceae bacterium]|jgi:Protein related to penicillin acylase|nr:penicillin acylase family protein [Pyrinomonadaceae bacterium]
MKRVLILALTFTVAMQFLPSICYVSLGGQTSSAATSIKVKGLKDSVTIRRDERGIPYIDAKNDEDLYFAQGYVTAQDRLWQMDLFRRNARGELSEVLPNVPNSPALDQDKLHRTLGFSQVVEAEVVQASPQSRAVLEAYAAGVNAYISTLDQKSLPPEFRILGYTPKPWTPADSLIVIKIFFEALSNTWRLDLMREAVASLPAEKRAALLPEISPIDVLVVGTDSKLRNASTTAKTSGSPLSPEALSALARDEAINRAALEQLGFYAEGLAASNNWVVNGKHTTSGKPLLANDPHLAPTAPPIWHMVHLTAPGVRVAGVTAPGLPGVVIGHNDRIAWGFTNVGPDVQDVYLEKFDPNNPQKYMTLSGWRDAKIRHEEIKVRKGLADLSADTITLDVTETRHGPIVFERDGKRYALRWTALDPTKNKPDSTFQLNRARNWKEFSKALEAFTAPTQNIVYADVDGHIGYHAAGVVPVRKSGDGSLPYDGSTEAGDWVSYIPIDKLPQVYDPQSGIIVTANQRIVGTDYPYFLTHSWAQPYRARRIFDLLNQKPRLNADDFRRIQGDVYSIAGVLFTKQVVQTLKPTLTQADEKLAAVLSSFESWDGLVNAESRVALLAAQMRLAFRSRILTAALGDELVKTYQWSNFDTTLDRIIKDQPADWLPKGFKTYADLFRVCYDDAVKALTRSLGKDESKWTWGEMVKARFPHPLAPAPLIGAQFTIQPFPQNGTGGFIGATVNVGAAVSMRLIADPSNWDLTQHGISVGESGVPSSPHWKDQLDDWKAVTPRVFPFSEAAVAAAAKETLVLQP